MVSPLLVKKLAVGLVVSQIFTNPANIKMKFDPVGDYTAIVKTMNEGCKHFYDYAVAHDTDGLLEGRDPEKMLTDMAKNDPDFQQVLDAYLLFCKNKPSEPSDSSKEMVSATVEYYNKATDDLPKAEILKSLKLPVSSVVLDSKNQVIGDVSQKGNRRNWIDLKEVPELVKNAFIAAEDKNFYAHAGVDEAGVLHAAQGSASSGGSKHPIGGSTIDQQLIKNVVVGDQVEESRKIREMIIASQVETQKILTKDQILELYLNEIYFGFSAWGIKTAAQAYFGKLPKDLKLEEAAMLAGLVQGPLSRGPSNPDRMKKRIVYVLDQMVKLKTRDGNMAITQEQHDKAIAAIPSMQFNKFLSRKSFAVDKLIEATKGMFDVDPTAIPVTIHSTLNSRFQWQNEFSLQEGLAVYEINFGRAKFSGPEKNLTDEIAKLPADPKIPSWLTALKQTIMPLYDVRWPTAVVLALGKGNANVGLSDGRVLPLRTWYHGAWPSLKINDVIYVLLHEASQNEKAYAELRFRPQVQGGALVIENKTGRVVSMVGGFSRALSEQNHTTDTERSTGSTIKIVTYLAALQEGLQPNMPMIDRPITFPEIHRGGGDWNPFNYGHDQPADPNTTMQMGLAKSRNQVTVRLALQIVPPTYENRLTRAQAAAASLDKILGVIKACGIDDDPDDYPSVILGSIYVPVIKMATCYATIANNGGKPTVHMIDSIDQDGVNYPYADPGLKQVDPAIADDASFFQLRTMLQGTPVRGTAAEVGAKLKTLVPAGASIGDYLAAKTGTSQGFRDSWFMGITNDLTIAVWVGYDNGPKDPKAKTPPPPHTLGERAEGAKVAGPIFQSIFVSSVEYYPLKPWDAPTESISAKLMPVPVEVRYGSVVRLAANQPLPNGIVLDYLRRDASGAPINSGQQVVVANPYGYPQNDGTDEDMSGMAEQSKGEWAQQQGNYSGGPRGQSGLTYNRQPRVPQQPQFNPFASLFGGGWNQQREIDDDQTPQQRPRYNRQPGQPQNINPNVYNRQPQQQPMPGIGGLFGR